MSRTLRALKSLRPPTPNAWFLALFGGGIASIITVAFGLSYSVLIFSGPLSQTLSYGIATTFLSTAIFALIIALGSAFPFAVAGPESATAAVAAILASSTIANVAGEPQGALLGIVLLTLAGATIITGATLCGLGLSRLGQAIRYVPYPVIGGFLGATGYLVFVGAIRVISDRTLPRLGWDTLSDPTKMSQIGIGCAMAATMFMLFRRYRMPYALPILLIGTVIATHLVLLALGIPLAEAQRTGWMFAHQPQVTFMVPWTTEIFTHYPWHALPSILGNIVAVIFVTAFSALFNTTGIEVVARREVSLERELKVTGVANIASGLFGGFTGCISLSRSLLTYNIGAASRLSGLIVALVSILVVIGSPRLLGYIPKFVLGGLLIYLGLDLCRRWLIESWQRLSRVEYASLLAIVLIILLWGFFAGVLIGIVIGCATFALTASRISSIKYRFDGTEYRSSLDRGGDDRAILARHGSEIQGLALQSYLFFGSANRLYEHTKMVLRRAPQTRFLILDFHLVTGADSSAAYSFTQIKQFTAELDVRLIVSGLLSSTEKLLRASDFLGSGVKAIDDLDRALEHCEAEIIAQYSPVRRDAARLHDWLTDVLGSAEHAETLIAKCQRLDFAAGDVIARVGDASDSMHFILSGRVGILVETDAGRTTRVRSLGRYTTVGEMGLVSDQPRSATIRAETASVLYMLPKDAFDTIKAQSPDLMQALLTYFMSVMAERLGFASRTIGVLRR